MKFLILTLFFSLKTISCFETIEICHKKPKECKINHGNSSILCESSRCLENKMYACGINHCKMNQEDCLYLLKMTSLVRSMSFSHISNLRKYRDFFNRINDCPSSFLECKTTNICVKETKCKKTKVVPTGIGFIIFENATDCGCKGAFSYQCNKLYCTTSKEDCENLSLLNKVSTKKRSALISKIKTC